MTEFVLRHRRLVLIATALFMVASFVVGGSVVKKLAGGGFADPAAPSTRAADALDKQFHAGDPQFLLLARADAGVDAPAAAAAGADLANRLAHQSGVESVTSYWATHSSALRSRDGKQALIVARIAGSDDQVTKRTKALKAQFEGRDGPLTLRAGGSGVIYNAVNDRIQRDLARAELIAFPVTFVLLVLVFGGVVAALLPLLIGLLAVAGTLLILDVLVSFTNVSVYALNMTTGLGLGLAIDYSLFIVTRYREERAGGLDTHDAIRMTVRTAGRTVLFSAMTVALSLSALLIFPLYFLRSFAYAGIAVVALAAVGAVVVLPAVLAALGRRIDSLTLWRRRPASATSGFWQRLASAVMRRPVLAGGAVLIFLLALGAPFLGVKFALPDDRVLPRNDAAQQVTQTLRDDFAGHVGTPLQVVSPTTRIPDGALTAYAEALSKLPNVQSVATATGEFVNGDQFGAQQRGFQSQHGTWLQVTPSVEAYSGPGKTLVNDVRKLPAPTPMLVGGASAQLLDTEHSLGIRLPYAGGLIALAMLAVLFLFTGSVLMPIKAIALNLLSLTATFGAMVFIFQDGHLAGLVGHPIITGTIDTNMPMLMFCVAFGLSMDYEVFLLSRIKETYDHHRDNTFAVAAGLERTGRLVTAAAALIAVVWLTFVTSGVSFIKMLGLGMALAVVADATLVRGVLVPAFMRLAGDWNWWAPPALRRMHRRLGLSEAAPVILPHQGGDAEASTGAAAHSDWTAETVQ